MWLKFGRNNNIEVQHSVLLENTINLLLLSRQQLGIEVCSQNECCLNLTYHTISSHVAYNLHISAGNLGIGLTVTGSLKIFGSNVEYFVLANGHRQKMFH